MTGLGPSGFLASVFAAVPAVAAAAPGDVTPVALWLPWLAVGLLVAVGLWLWFRGQAAKQAAHRALAARRSAEAEFAALIGSHAGGLFSWSKDGSSRFCHWQTPSDGSAAPASFEAFLAGLDADGRERVAAAQAELLAQASRFETDAAAESGDRYFQVTGAPLSDGGAAIWVRDVSGERAAVNDLRKSSEAVADQRNRLLEVTGTTQLPVWRRDGGFGLAWCNTAYAGIFETGEDEVVAQQLELASSAQQDRPRNLANQAKASGKVECEKRNFVVAGERRTFDVFEAPLADGDGTVGWALDVSDREEAITNLARHTGAHGEILQALTTAIAIYGPDKRLQLYNRAYSRLWRLSESWLDEHPRFDEVLEVLREQRRLPEQADFRAFKRTQMDLFTSVIAPQEELMHLPDERTLRSVITPHPLGGLLFVYEDVTDQLVLERNHNVLIAVQRATLDHLYEGVAVFGSDGRLKLFNPAFIQIWGLDDDRIIENVHINDVALAFRTHYSREAEWEDLRERMIGAAMQRLPQSGRIDRPDGTVIDYATMPLPDGAVLFTYLDVTDTTRIERALRERNEALEEADRLKSEFVANVSYELRTPLNTIIGFAEILNNQYFGPLTERQLEYGRGILDSGNQLLHLINDILDLATIEAGYMILEPDDFDLYDSVESVVGMIAERARYNGLTIENRCPKSIGPVFADERRLKQVIFNLLSNAIKFTPANGAIVIDVARDEDGLEFRVTDTGVGIAMADQERVFGKFQKTPQASRHKGAGLGLSLVKSFIELHGGTVNLASAPGEGTEVTCRLPAAILEQSGESPARQQAAHSDAD